METRHLREKNILLVIAHPDDEVMFFGPTLIGISKQRYNNKVSLLSLSNGSRFLRIQLMQATQMVLGP